MRNPALWGLLEAKYISKLQPLLKVLARKSIRALLDPTHQQESTEERLRNSESLNLAMLRYISAPPR